MDYGRQKIEHGLWQTYQTNQLGKQKMESKLKALYIHTADWILVGSFLSINNEMGKVREQNGRLEKD